MKIDFIQLINFRQYKKETIEFSTSDTQSLTIIQGANGTGKTNLLNAITWCLYGKEMHISEKYKGFPIVNTLTLRESPVGRRIGVGVRIIMKDENNKKIIFERGCEFKKSTDKDAKIIEGPVFKMKKQIEGDIELVQEPEYRLNRLIPRSIEEYFFFDGEKLDNYFREASGKKIRKAVFKISQVDLIENAIEHLENKKNNFVRQAKELSSEAIVIREDIDSDSELFIEYKQELTGFKQQKEEAEKKEKKYRKILSTNKISDIKELEEKRGKIESELKKLDSDIKELKQGRDDYLINMSLYIFAYDQIIKMKLLISGKEESGDIPPDYKKNFLEKLLEKGRCICGTDISRNNNCRKRIEMLLQECDEISEISDELIRENVQLRSILDDLKDFDKKRIPYGKNINRLEEDRRKKSEMLHRINDIFENSNIEQIKKCNKKIGEYKELKERLIGKISIWENNIREIEKRIKKLNRDLINELNKEKKHKRLIKNLEFCGTSLDALINIKNEIMNEIRKEIEENTKNQFFDLIWKKGTFKNIKIDEDYNISVVDQYGMEGIGTLSAGERQVLALSFIAALNKVSGFDVPIIIDTPLARISREPKKNIANNLLNYMKGKQVILLMTEEEYTQEVRDRLFKRVGKEYVIDFKESKVGGEVKVVPYGE